MRAPLLVVVGSLSLAGCCSAAGCGGFLVITVSRALTDEATVEVDLGDGFLACVPVDELTGGAPCVHGDGDDGREIRVPTSDAPAWVSVVIVEEAFSVGEILPVEEHEPYAPNGRRCGPVCQSGEATLVLPPSGP